MGKEKNSQWLLIIVDCIIIVITLSLLKRLGNINFNIKTRLALVDIISKRFQVEILTHRTKGQWHQRSLNTYSLMPEN